LPHFLNDSNSFFLSTKNILFYFFSKNSFNSSLFLHSVSPCSPNVNLDNPSSIAVVATARLT